MTPTQIFYLFLVLAAFIASVFYAVARTTRQAGEVDAASAYRLRGLFFYSLLAILAVALALTLPRTPYPTGGASPERVVHVMAKQFAFALSDQPITTDEEYERQTYAPPVQLRRGSTVEFRVTSLDVNHAFSLYSPSNRLLAQTQAMPGYVNRLRVRLEEPGTHRVLCLEMCGLAHHRMRGLLEVN